MNLDKLHKKISEVKELDKEIVIIEKMLNTLAGQPSKIGFEMTVKTEKEKENILGEDGSLKSDENKDYNSVFFRYAIEPIIYCKQEDDNKLSFNCGKLNEPMAMQILSYLHKEYTTYREKILKEIKV